MVGVWGSCRGCGHLTFCAFRVWKTDMEERRCGERVGGEGRVKGKSGEG